MITSITVRHLPRRGFLRDLAQERIGFALDRFVDHIERLHLHLDQESALPSDVDQRCLIHLHLQTGDDIVVERKHAHAPGAIHDCLESVQNALRRKLGKRRMAGKRQHRRIAA